MVDWLHLCDTIKRAAATAARDGLIEPTTIRWKMTAIAIGTGPIWLRIFLQEPTRVLSLPFPYRTQLLLDQSSVVVVRGNGEFAYKYIRCPFVLDKSVATTRSWNTDGGLRCGDKKSIVNLIAEAS